MTNTKNICNHWQQNKNVLRKYLFSSCKLTSPQNEVIFYTPFILTCSLDKKERKTNGIKTDKKMLKVMRQKKTVWAPRPPPP